MRELERTYGFSAATMRLLGIQVGVPIESAPVYQFHPPRALLQTVPVHRLASADKLRHARRARLSARAARWLERVQEYRSRE
jgi:hypothetical protein